METRPRRFWVFDLETINGCFVACFSDFKTKEMRTYVVHALQNDWQALLDFIVDSVTHKDYYFGYNNLKFDAQIIEHIYRNLKKVRKFVDPTYIGTYLQEYAGYVIGKSNAGEFLDYPEYKLSIPNMDVFRLNHWDNAAKRSS